MVSKGGKKALSLFLSLSLLSTFLSSSITLTFANFARLLADAGATTPTSAHRRSSMCRTGSPTRLHALHSSSSPLTGLVAAGKSSSLKKRRAESVAMTRTSLNSERRRASCVCVGGGEEERRV